MEMIAPQLSDRPPSPTQIILPLDQLIAPQLSDRPPSPTQIILPLDQLIAPQLSDRPPSPIQNHPSTASADRPPTQRSLFNPNKSTDS